MDRFWLKSYPPGMPADIDPGEISSLKELIESSLKQFADRTAFIHMGKQISYRELDQLSAQFAGWLQGRAGLKKGDRVAIMLPNLLQYPVVMFGVLRAGLVVVNTNPLYTPTELQHQLQDSGASAVIVLENFAITVEKSLAGTQLRQVIVTQVGDLLDFPKSAVVNFVVRRVQKRIPAWNIPGALRFKDVMKQARQHTLQSVSVDHSDLAFLQYTGGTTGVAKGAMLTHRNMVANLLQCRAWFQQVALDHVTYVCALPLYHIFSLTANCLLFTSLGGSGLLITNPRDFPAFIADLRRHRPMFFMGVNTLFNALMNTPGFDRIDFKGLVATVGGGMAVQKAVADRWLQLTGCTITQGWGLTEASPVGCCTLLRGDKTFTGSIGLPVPSTELSIRGDGGEDLGVDASGEICLRGPQVMRGYWNRPDETAQVITADGWLRTGDIGRVDANGFVFIEDRKKDMIIVSGFKVFPNEVEDVVTHMPGIAECAAVAQQDPHSGECVALFVVRKDPALTAEAVIAYCHTYLTSYKVPRHVYFRQELPKTNVGKILRRALRDELAAGKGAVAKS
ncbi:MAG: AMP-binding protein [Steroidobacteraceae bacterium]